MAFRLFDALSPRGLLDLMPAFAGNTSSFSFLPLLLFVAQSLGCSLGPSLRHPLLLSRLGSLLSRVGFVSFFQLLKGVDPRSS